MKLNSSEMVTLARNAFSQHFLHFSLDVGAVAVYKSFASVAVAKLS